MSVLVTPFGNLTYGSEDGIKQWLAAHDLMHRNYNQVVALAGEPAQCQPLGGSTVDSDWLARNLFAHIAINRILNVSNPNPNVAFADIDWSSEEQFYDWHEQHNNDHQLIDNALGINGNSF